MADNIPQTIFYYASRVTTTTTPLLSQLPPVAVTVLTIVTCLVVASYIRRLINYIWSLALNVAMGLMVAYFARAVYDMGPEKALQMVYDQGVGLANFAVEAGRFFWREWERYEREAKRRG